MSFSNFLEKKFLFESIDFNTGLQRIRLEILQFVYCTFCLMDDLHFTFLKSVR